MPINREFGGVGKAKGLKGKKLEKFVNYIYKVFQNRRVRELSMVMAI